MKPTTVQRTVIAAALVAAIAGLSATAIAQNQPEGGRPAAIERYHNRDEMQGERMKHMAERHGQRHAQLHAQRQAALKEQLKLTPQQEAAWAAYSVRTEPGEPRKQAFDREAFKQLTTPERLERIKTHQTERQNAMNERFEAIKSFYAVLTPEQKKVFDEQGPLNPPRMHDRRGHRHGHGQGPEQRGAAPKTPEKSPG